MKTFVVVLLATACFTATVHGYPGSRDSSSSSSSSSKSSFSSSSSSSSSSDESDERKNVDTVLVLPPDSRRHLVRPFLDIGDTSADIDDSFESFLPSTYFHNPLRSGFFDGFLENMDNLMKRLREQMAGILSRIPERDVVPWRKIPEGANTTSTTKIIDGHVVTINETTYMDGDDEHGTLIRVRVIDVKPQNDTILMTESEADAAEVTTLPTSVTETESTTQSRSVETVEDFDNEIPKNQVETLTA